MCSRACSHQPKLYIGHDYIGHSYVGHDYIGQNYIGHDYVGHDHTVMAVAATTGSGQASPRRIAISGALGPPRPVGARRRPAPKICPKQIRRGGAATGAWIARAGAWSPPWSEDLFFLANFRVMPTADAKGEIESEGGGIGKVSGRDGP